jgi:opacity protein-like surface antigen
MRRVRPVAIAALSAAMMLIASASVVEAQGARDAGRFELAAGVTWTGHVSFGSADATEVAPGGGFTLFSTSTEFAAAPGVEVKLGVRVTPAFDVEVSSQYAQPRLQIKVSGDAEGAAALTASESAHQYVIDGALMANLPRWRIGMRTTPFVLAGVGYARQLHEGQTLAESGQRYFAGGGLKYLLASRPHRVRTIGVRAEARALAQRQGVAFDHRMRVAPTVGASLFVTF